MATHRRDDERAKKVFTNGFTKRLTLNTVEWPENLTTIDLSNRNIALIDDAIKFPPNLVDLNLSKNELDSIPNAVMCLEKLKVLDVSYNKIIFFDDTPYFCGTIESLDLSHNMLSGPPYWVWTQNPENLKDLNLSFNLHLAESFKDGYFEELIQYTTPVTNIKINNCRLKNHLSLLCSFPKAKVVEIGSDTLSRTDMNSAIEIPFDGLDKCCDIENLKLNNIQIYTVLSNIDIFKSLVEINLSQNYISGLPNEFCNLCNLEVCILSCNQLLYLPDDIYKLKKLRCLLLDGNELCMLPDTIAQLKDLITLDVYDNCLYEYPDKIKEIPEIDLAQNYLDEPDDNRYHEQKSKLRLNKPERYDGRKAETVMPDSDHSYDATDDEEYLESLNNETEYNKDPPSSEEDWDSDEYWVPRYYGRTSPCSSPWLYFVKKKMEEGNFCPMDVHPVSVAEKVKYEKLCNPKVEYESEGQFDDYSDDNS